MTAMRIAIAPYWNEPLNDDPSQPTTGVGSMLHPLVETLVERGHDVTVFGVGTSRTSAHMHVTLDTPLDKRREPWQSWALVDDFRAARRSAFVQSQMREIRTAAQTGQFDVVHIHDLYQLWMAAELGTPLLATVHLPISRVAGILRRCAGVPLVALSHSQQQDARHIETPRPLNWVDVIPNGLKLKSRYHLGRGDGGYFVFLGRIAPDKGPDIAIRMALAAGVPIKVAGPVSEAYTEYWLNEVAPLIQKNPTMVEYLGEISDVEKDRLLGGALALLAPIRWQEPFGVVFLEARACGAQVLTMESAAKDVIGPYGVRAAKF
jgi:glycosyltransferase involved in cell wall biosynthesis